MRQIRHPGGDGGSLCLDQMPAASEQVGKFAELFFADLLEGFHLHERYQFRTK